MAPSERRIIVYDGEKKVYEGPENRHSQSVAMIQPNKMFGMSVETWVKVVGFIVAITVFYIRTDDFMKSQASINAYVTRFMQNSDAYHSSVTGQAFEQGRPSGWGGRRGAGNINVTTPAHAAENQEER